MVQVDIWRLAATHDVEQARSVDQTRHRGDFILGLWRLEEGHVGTGG
jgi:hypothetical protein